MGGGINSAAAGGMPALVVVAVSVAPPVENVLWRYRYRHRQCAVKGRAASRCGTGIAAVSVSVVGVSCGWRYAAAGGMPALVVVTVSVAPQVVSPPRSHYRRVLTTAAFVPNATAGRGQLLQRLRDLHTAAMSVPRSSPYRRGGEARGGRGINSASVLVPPLTLAAVSVPGFCGIDTVQNFSGAVLIPNTWAVSVPLNGISTAPENLWTVSIPQNSGTDTAELGMGEPLLTLTLTPNPNPNPLGPPFTS